MQGDALLFMNISWIIVVSLVVFCFTVEFTYKPKRKKVKEKEGFERVEEIT